MERNFKRKKILSGLSLEREKTSTSIFSFDEYLIVFFSKIPQIRIVNISIFVYLRFFCLGLKVKLKTFNFLSLSLFLSNKYIIKIEIDLSTLEFQLLVFTQFLIISIFLRNLFILILFSCFILSLLSFFFLIEKFA